MLAFGDAKDVSFACEDQRCAALWFAPGGEPPRGGWPAVVIGHGFDGVIDQRLPDYARRFRDAGIGALIFDYRHFGYSQGDPRQLVAHATQLADWRAAIACARALPGVDAGRVALWGTSTSGGYVVTLAAEDRRIAAAVVQMPVVDGTAQFFNTPLRKSARLVAAALLDKLASRAGMRVSVAASGEPGTFAVTTSSDAVRGLADMTPPGSPWRNDVLARFALDTLRYKPLADAPRIRCPLLVCVADRDEIVPYRPALKLVTEAPYGQLRHYPWGHFAMYNEHFDEVVSDQAHFLRRQLDATTGAPPQRLPTPPQAVQDAAMAALDRGERREPTRWEKTLQGSGAALAGISAGFAAAYLYKGVRGPSEYPYTTNSIAKDALLQTLSLSLAWDVRRWSPTAAPLLVGTHLLMPVVLVTTKRFSPVRGFAHTWGGPPADPAAFRRNWFVGDLLVAGWFALCSSRAVRSRYDMRYLPPSAFRSLMALSEVLVIRDDHEVAPAEVAGRVDHYLDSLDAHEKWKVRIALTVLAYWPLLTGRPPLWLLAPASRQRYLERRFIDTGPEPLVPAKLKELRGAMLRTAQQMAFMGYYGDQRAAAKVDYLPFSRRNGAYTQAVERDPIAGVGRVRTMDPRAPRHGDLRADVVVVGTGAAGATLAYGLARAGRDVLMLERGRHVDRSQFTENEATQLGMLYSDGALTLSKDFRFQVAQGMCVGGSTVVNNAVCLPLPDHVRDVWNGPEHDAGLDEADLADAFAAVSRLLQIAPVAPDDVLNPGGLRIAAAVPGFEVVHADIHGCVGSGYCNMGCAYGRKLSALDWTLPKAQREHPGKVRILPECRVQRVVVEGGRARGVEATLPGGRRVRVEARHEVVLSAGALASSVILQQSDLGGERAGTGLAFNMGSPLTLDFGGEAIHSERGLQISHVYLSDGARPSFALETWFNPIVAQSLFTPGWFATHRANMERYAHMTCLGVVVASHNGGTVRPGRFPSRGGVDLGFEPTPAEMHQIREALKVAARFGFDAGATRAMPATLRYVEARAPGDLGAFDGLQFGDLSINTSHPQGGNAISADPGKGVVDQDFAVRGVDGLRVCDASVFPTAILVNPQMTVMALAAYLARRMTGVPVADARPAAPA